MKKELTKNYHHIPVLAKETLEFLNPREGSIIADLTAGGGGHLRLICEALNKSGTVIALDRDLRAHADDAAGQIANKYSDLVKFYHTSFSHIYEILQKHHNGQLLDGFICDLGVSSFQLDNRERGFSFAKDGPLDMRMDTTSKITAFDVVNYTDKQELADIIYKYGDEKRSRQIAHEICRKRPLPDSTDNLAKIIAGANYSKNKKIHPATKTFQAIRIKVNNELGELEDLLEQLPKILNKNGIAVFISFHSLEDRLVKNKFKELKNIKDQKGNKLWHILTKGPVVSSREELNHNYRCRSAKLRAIQKIGEM